MSNDILASNDDASDGNDDKQDPSQEIVIPEEVEDLLKDLPEPQQKAVRAVLLGISYQRIWKGPLPPPDVLKEYNEAFANGAERIFIEAQKQTDHRMSLESHVIPEELRQSERGQHYGLAIALSFLAASVLLVMTGHDVSGTIIGSIDLVALVTVFVYGRNNQRRELKDKN
jgi:uncharacterized membrane protein